MVESRTAAVAAASSRIQVMGQKTGAAMLDIKRILCPIDFSEFSGRALEHAVAIARWYDAPITVLHVVDVRCETPVGAALAPVIAPAALISPARAQVAAELQRLVAAATAPGVRIETLVRDGRPDTAILELADALPADVLVMGTHGRSGFDHLVMGSVTEKVLRKATCPVLSLPPGSRDDVRGSVALKSILCPVDFSESSMRALQCAVSLAEEADAHLTVLHVARPLASHDTMVYAPLSLPDAQAQYERHLRHRLGDFVPGAARVYCTIEEQVTSGKPWREILRVAEDQDAELIVIGVRGRTSTDVMLFGSTTHHVVRQATCPVLSIRS
jgi:nucleotide-binding universal stress UspA family protein